MVAELAREVWAMADNTDDQEPTGEGGGAERAPLYFEAFDSGQALVDAVFPASALRDEDTELGGSPWPWQVHPGRERPDRGMFNEALTEKTPTSKDREKLRLPRQIADEDTLDASGTPVLDEDMLAYIAGQVDPLSWMCGVVRQHADAATTEAFRQWVRTQRAVAIGVEEISDYRKVEAASILGCSVEDLEERLETAYAIIRLHVWFKCHPTGGEPLPRSSPG